MVGGGFLFRKWLGMLVALGITMGALAQFVLVPLAEKALVRFAAKLPADRVEVEIASFPAWELLQGSIDRLNWQAEGIQFLEFTLERLEGSFEEVRLSWWELWQERRPDYSFAEPGEVIITLSEDNLKQYLMGRLNVPLENPEVAIQGLQVELTAAWTIGGQKLPLLLTGRLELEGSHTIVLIPERVQVGSFVPGSELQKKLLGNASFQLPVERLPVRVEFYRLEGGPGKIRLLGRVFLK